MAKHNLFSFCIGVAVLLCSCSNNVKTDNAGLLNLNYQLTHSIDSTRLNPEVSSGHGMLAADSANIYLLDFKFGTLSVFDFNGGFQKRLFGLGKGPHELPFIPHKFGISPSGTIVFVGDHSISFGSITESSVKTLSTNWMVSTPINVLQNKPKGSMSGIYEVDWSKAENRIALSDSLIYLPIIAYHPLLNGYMHSKYYKTTRVVGAFNYNGELVTMFGERSKEYLKQKFIANFDKAYIAHGSNLTYISFAIDSLIYVYDNNGKLVTEFGKGYPNLNQNYPKHASYEIAESNYISDWANFGTYQSIKCSPTDSVLVRLIFPKAGEKTALQLFKNNAYVGSITTPKNFKLAYIDTGVIIGHTIPSETSREINLVTITYSID